MSVVTGVMLIVGYGDDVDEAPVKEIQQWLSDRHNGQQLVDVADHAGGGKHPQFYAFSAGINFFHDCDEFAEYVISRDWVDPENVVLILQPENGMTRVFRPKGY